jgi:hypothetical protein
MPHRVKTPILFASPATIYKNQFEIDHPRDDRQGRLGKDGSGTSGAMRLTNLSASTATVMEHSHS